MQLTVPHDVWVYILHFLLLLYYISDIRSKWYSHKCMVGDGLLWCAAYTGDCQLCCSVTLCISLHMGIKCVLQFQVSYIISVSHIVNCMCLICCNQQSCPAIALFLCSICSYHQICIFLLSPTAELRAAPALDLVSYFGSLLPFHLKGSRADKQASCWSNPSAKYK